MGHPLSAKHSKQRPAETVEAFGYADGRQREQSPHVIGESIRPLRPKSLALDPRKAHTNNARSETSGLQFDAMLLNFRRSAKVLSRWYYGSVNTPRPPPADEEETRLLTIVSDCLARLDAARHTLLHANHILLMPEYTNLLNDLEMARVEHAKAIARLREYRKTRPA